jgi:hypothetical protein
MSDKPKRVITQDYYGQLIGEVPRMGGRPAIPFFIRGHERDHLYIEARRWTEMEGYSGPSKQGITLRPDQVDLFIDLLQKARQELERQEEAGPKENISADIL